METSSTDLEVITLTMPCPIPSDIHQCEITQVGLLTLFVINN